MKLCTAFLLITLASTTLAQEDSSDRFYIKNIYIVPSNSPQKGNEQYGVRATQLVQEQWAGWGWTWEYDPTIDAHSVPETCEDLNHFSRINAMVKQLGYPPRGNIIYQAFVECASSPGAAAYSSGWLVVYLGGVMRGMVNQIDNLASRRHSNNIGVLGHELGHSFGLGHENCRGSDSMRESLERQGFPGDVTRGVMCNGFWPETIAPYPHQRELMFYQACNFFAECRAGLPVGRAVQAVHSKKCIAVVGDAVVQTECEAGNKQQLFRVLPVSPEGFLLQTMTGKCLMPNHANRKAKVVTRRCSHGNRGRQTVVRDETSKSLKFLQSDLCLHVQGESQRNGAALVQWNCGGDTDGLKFDVYADPTAVAIQVVHSGKCIEVVASTTQQIQQRECEAGKEAQSFKEIPVSPEGFLLKSVQTGKCLAVQNGSTKRGAGVIQEDCGFSEKRQTIVRDEVSKTVVFLHSGMCLRVREKRNGARIVQWNCASGSKLELI